MSDTLSPQRQRLIVYGPQTAPTVYASAYDDKQVDRFIADCCATHGRTCGARAEDGVTVALKHQARDSKFGEVVGK